MALRDLAGAEVPITLVAPSDAFVYRPMQVSEPFALGHARRCPLAELTREFGAVFVREPVVEVRATAHEAVLGSGAALPYEALVLAPGARAEPAFEHAITSGQEGARDALEGLLADLEGGYARRVAFVVPPGVT
jgi:sulfide:quinone oxidoreductase